MPADAGAREYQEESSQQNQPNEENPFGQEEVLPSIPREGEDDSEPPLIGGQRSADYMPEDAVIEYGYQAGEDFYDPSKSREGEEDSVFMTEEPASPGQPQPPAPPQPSDPSIDQWENQLDNMFPDDSFKKEGSLDWNQREEKDPASLTEPYPSSPLDNQQVNPTEVNAEMQEEGVPDSPSGYVVITPSGRKKGLSPEIAQLLDRTSKRQTPVKAGEEGKKVRITGTIVLTVFLLAFASASGYMYMRADKAGREVDKVEERARASMAKYRQECDSTVVEAKTEKQDFSDRFEKTSRDFEDYKAKVKHDMDHVESLRESIRELEASIASLQEETAKIPELQKDLEHRQGMIDWLNGKLQNAKTEVRTLEEGILLRATDMAELQKNITDRENRIKSLENQLYELVSRPGHHISANELARLRDAVHKKDNKIDALDKLARELKSQLDEITRGVGGDVNRLRMKLVRRSEEVIKLQEEIENLQYARRRYSSPENTIVEWAQAHGSGELDGIIEYYAEKNIHRKRWVAGGAQREELLKEYKEFANNSIEPEVISITIDPQQGTATAKLIIKLTADGRTMNVKAKMVLVREFERWAILDEGF